MLFFKRIYNMLYLLIFINGAIILDVLHANVSISITILSILAGYFVFYNVIPMKQKESTLRLSILINGCELLRNSCLLFPLQILIYILLILTTHSLSISAFSVTLSLFTACVAIIIMLWNGLLRIIFASSQLGILFKILLIFVWWIPILNNVIFYKCCHIARREYYFELSKIELNEQRKENEICKTKYPILLVHGIFGRD